MEPNKAVEVNPQPTAHVAPELASQVQGSGQDDDVEAIANAPPGNSDLEPVYPDTLRLIFATFALMAAFLIAALDVHILATAIPRITTEFDSLIDLTWYGGTYLLAQIAVQPTYARVYQMFPIKHVFFTSLALFEVGSIVGATATSSHSLIAGRAVQGTGSGGIVAGCLLIINFLVPKPKRPVYLSIVTIVYSVASVIGPVLGGLITESHLTWRFCFWMNLPIGSITCALLAWSFTEPERNQTKQPLGQKLKALNPLGASVFTACVTCLFLALQRASIPQPWSYSGIWGPLLAFGILLAIFAMLQVYQKDEAIIPYRILAQRTVAFCCLCEVGLLMASTTVTYYLPFYFQSVKGLSPHDSGIHILPYVVTNSIFAFIGGAVTFRTGIYVPFMCIGAGIMAIGGGLLYTLDISSGLGPILGYQFVASAGFGLCVQVPYTAVQVLPDKDIPIGNGLMAFFQGLGSALAISAAQTIFSNSLHDHLAAIPNVNADVIVSYGAVNFVNKVPSNLVMAVRIAYSAATRDAFKLTIAGAAIASLAGLCVEWRRNHVPGKNKVSEGEEPGVTQREILEVKAD